MSNNTENKKSVTRQITASVKEANNLVIAIIELFLTVNVAIGLASGTVHIDDIYLKSRYIEKIIDISTNKQQVDDKDTINIKKQLKQSPNLK